MLLQCKNGSHRIGYGEAKYKRFGIIGKLQVKIGTVQVIIGGPFGADMCYNNINSYGLGEVLIIDNELTELYERQHQENARQLIHIMVLRL